MLLNKELKQACKNGDIEKVHSLLDQGEDVDGIARNGQFPGHHYGTYLYFATKNKHIEVARLLLKNGANVNAIGKGGRRILFAAIDSGRIDLVQLLLDYKADVNIQGLQGITALHCAAEEGYTEIAELLIQKGAKLDSYSSMMNHDGTPLHAAVKSGCMEVLFLLLLYGAEKDRQKINEKPELANCLAEFERIEGMPCLGELMEAYKDGNKNVISKYINSAKNQEALIEEFKIVKEHYSSHEQLSFIPEYLCDFIKHKSQQYLSEYKRNLFGTGALYGLLEQVIGSSLILPTKNYEFDSNSAYNISLTCQNTYKHANFHMNTYLKKENRKVETLYTELKEVTSLRSICTIL